MTVRFYPLSPEIAKIYFGKSKNWLIICLFVTLFKMDSKRLETKVGLFVVLGLALLATLLILFSKSISPFSRTYELRLHASNVGGLKERAGVLLAGVQVGSVSSIQLAGDGKSVTILLNIYQGCKIYRDARFIIEQSGFLGDQYVSIIPTENTVGCWSMATRSTARSRLICRRSRARPPGSSSALTTPPKNSMTRSRICGASC